MSKTALTLLVLVWGVQAIVTQTLLMREALVLMFGSEFAWGVVWFAWLLGVSGGAIVGGRLARHCRVDFWLVVVLLSLGVAACVEFWVFRGARAWLGMQAGELLPLSKTAVAAMLFVSPVSALVGLAFPLACCIGSTGGRSGLLSLSQVYALESAGSLIGGAVFSFWAVEHLAPIEIALACLALTAVAGGLLAVATRRLVTAAVLGGVAMAAVVAAGLGGKTLNWILVERRWNDVAPGYVLCAETESKYQNLAVGRRAEQFTLYCDGQVTADFPDPYSFVPQAHLWMYQHPAPRRVLVLGGGAEGLLAQILRHRVEQVDYVEPDPRQIEIIEPFLADADRRALADRRVTVHHMDARHFVKTQRSKFDLVIARLPEPTSALRARFYTDEFYGELRQAMTSRAVLCTTAAAAPGELSEISGEYLAAVRAGLLRHFPKVVVSWGDPAQVLAATDAGLLPDGVAGLTRRYSRRGVESDLFHPLLFEEQFDPDKLRRRADELDAVEDVGISTDLKPVVYIQRLMLWDRMTGGSSGRIIERLHSISLGKLAVGLALLAAVTVVGCRLRWRSPRGFFDRGWTVGAIVLSVWTTGFATMALSIVWLFAFQNLYGDVYSRIGWIIAVFMGGLVLGCWLGGRGSACWWRLVLVDVLLALLAFAIPLILPVLGAVQGTELAFGLVEWAVSTMVALTGVLGGAAFAVSCRLQLSITKQVAVTAGTIDGADHAGACLGALLTGVLLVPIFGIATTACLLGVVKLGSALVLTALARDM